MANPVLEKTFGEEAAADGALAAGQEQALRGPVSADGMTIGGVVGKTAFLLALVVTAAGWGWGQVDATGAIPGWYLWVLFGTIGVAIFAAIRPQFAMVLGPIFAVLEGLLVGVISKIYDATFDGIIIQALLATVATFVGMLLLYATGIIKASPKFRKVVIGATLGIALFYLLSIVLSLFGVSMNFVWDGSPLGILISLAIIVVAALNLVLDFDFIERGVEAGLPRPMEWMAAFGLMVTIVWLYLEFLRLFARLNQN